MSKNLISEELMQMLLKVSHKVKPDGTLTNSFYEVPVTKISKPRKDPTKKITDQFHL